MITQNIDNNVPLFASQTGSHIPTDASRNFVTLHISSSVTNLEKPKRLKVKKPPPLPKNTEITFYDFFKGGKVAINLRKYKIPELKKIARFNHLLLGGNKPRLIERIEVYFLLNLYATKIQAYARRFFIRRMFKLRGPGYNAIEKCVNDSDFYTLEPLAEIPKQEFFSYSSGGPSGPSIRSEEHTSELQSH